MTIISSKQNPTIKLIQKLKKASNRIELKLFVVYGFNENIIALQSNRYKNNALLLNIESLSNEQKNQFKRIDHSHYKKYEINAELLQQLSYGSRNDGIIGIYHYPQHKISDIFQKTKKQSQLIILENIENPGNLGAILRTVDAANGDGVILCDSNIEITNPNAIRASVGAFFTVPIAVASKLETKKFLESNNYAIKLITPNTTKNIYSDNVNIKQAIVFGNEHDGISSFWLDANYIALKLPMAGKINSLNLSNAVAVTTYEYQRQLSIKTEKSN
jgi:RNA methyltransferase, TrmH family